MTLSIILLYSFYSPTYYHSTLTLLITPLINSISIITTSPYTHLIFNRISINSIYSYSLYYPTITLLTHSTRPHLTSPITFSFISILYPIPFTFIHDSSLNLIYLIILLATSLLTLYLQKLHFSIYSSYT